MASQIKFDRKWKIVLETKRKVGNTYRPLKDKTLRDLKVTFNVRNTLLGDPLLATFQIYNINAETESMITSHNCFITFYAGYYSDKDANLEVLFQGEITNSYKIRQGVDTIWNVWARNAFSLLNYSKVDLQPIKVDTAPKQVLQKLVNKATGLSTIEYLGDADSIISSAESDDNYTFDGTYKEEFDNLLINLGLGWQVIGNKLIVFNQQVTDPKLTNERAIPISFKTGLLTVPVVDYKGVEFKTLLMSELVPGKVISIEPNTTRYNLGNEFYVEQFDKSQWRASGKFRIFEVTHRGDTRGDRWQTDVVAFYRRN